MARPGPGIYLRLERLEILNPNAGDMTANFSLLNPADIATITVNTIAPMVDLQSPIDRAGGLARTGSTVSACVHTSALGEVMAQVIIPSGTSRSFDLGPSIYLDGDAPGGIGGFMLWNSTVNEIVRVAFFGREYFNRG